MSTRHCMYRRKDFMWMYVYDLQGKKLGFIRDLIIDMNENSVKGFVVSGMSLLKSVSTVLVKDIVSFNKYMIVKKLSKDNYLKFNNIRGLDVIDNSGNVEGIVEEIIFQISNFKIKGLIISRGILCNFKEGKKVILQRDYIIGDRNILHIDKNKKFNFVTVFHKLNLEDGENEKKT
ncbi:hypothetical protein CPAST_c21510 [Clostridium pasteurianum DSM 525 = ATCC 6013]|uniref:PRC-barrel domain protein n=3 Tax=Clostridium pasteurianum TaxID=1501 RepID=A0A0H3J2S7_CLOPA|nr:PRC-barrel domain-containing protein [Clostridium pasteurianum]AJA48221.1 hypothetical protein CPAST_c21510 [Clostridium pasteurianum DSM 525 = ATCC 6013]AJA52209.1 hypothetical protein CLPA_c21510 [Clostridium pasteurianum DSM 525 = ATCC 6013]KRU11781.1 PRC-barrel domain protein [Clostridium pasteurianum DSM 525 = ATCC 6013]UZW12438.1 PRC-barrel domain-containing protein [Clostridium pasteurianum]